MDGFPCKSIDQIIRLHAEKYQLNLTLSTPYISNRKKQAIQASHEIFWRFHAYKNWKAHPILV